MNKLALQTFVWLVVVGPAAVGQEWVRRMFDETSHDFGRVARDSVAQHAFTFRNIYQEDIHVVSVRSSCGCTTAMVAQETLGPGETSEVLATFDTHSFDGRNDATITVTFDKPFRGEVQLEVRGYIDRDVVLSPAAIELGTVDQEEGAEQGIEIRYTGGGTWQIDEVQSTSPYIETMLTEPRGVGGETVYDLAVRLKPGCPSGYINERIYLVTGSEPASRLPVVVTGRIDPELTISPASLFFGVLERGQEVTKRLVIRGQQPFRVLRVECDDDRFEFRPAGESRALHLLPVTFHPDGQEGTVERTIRVVTNLDYRTVKEFTAIVRIKPAADRTRVRSRPGER